MTIQSNKEAMRLFEKMINTNDTALAKQLVDEHASFLTPASPTPLYGGEGYLAVVDYMRTGFSDIQWHIQDMVSEDSIVAVRWQCSGTHNGLFMNIAPTGKHFQTTVMNFYYFNEAGKIINDIAAEGMIGILRAIGVCP